MIHTTNTNDTFAAPNAPQRELSRGPAVDAMLSAPLAGAPVGRSCT